MSCTEDMDRAFDLYQLIASDSNEHLTATVLPGPPPSKARHRHTRSGRTYKTADDIGNEDRTRDHLRRVVAEPFTGNVALACIFYRPNRQRIDTDNMLKHVCDAANGVLWVDDSQVTAVLGLTELDVDNPRTLIVVGNHTSTLTRGTDDALPCHVCGVLVERAGRNKIPKTCSPECRAAVKGHVSLAAHVPCAHCGEPYRRTTATQTFCSVECRGVSRKGVSRNPRQLSECMDCGAQLTHSRGGRCRSCWKASIQIERLSEESA